MPFMYGSGASHDDTGHFGSAKRDGPSGVAGLSAGKNLQLSGSNFGATRDGSNDVKITEIISGETVAVMRRTGANAYTWYNNTVAGGKIIQDSSMKDVASGIAGLDTGTQLDVVQMRPCREKYNNHLGATDNFTQTAVSGGGSATADATNHEMDLSTAAAAVSYAHFSTKKSWTLGTKPISVEFIIQNLANGSGGDKYTSIGLQNDFTTRISLTEGVVLNQGQNDVWRFVSYGASSFTEVTPLTIASGDHVCIIATSASLKLYVNGVLVGTIATNISLLGLYAGANVVCDAASGTARTVSIDMMDIERYI